MYLLTGSTGFLGREILARLVVDPAEIRAPGDRQISVVVRPNSGVDPEARVKELLGSIFGSEADRFADRVEVIPGDITEQNFGLGDAEFDALARRIVRVYHSAASTDLNPSLEEARKNNVAGTIHTLDLARRSSTFHGTPTQFFHISTAYVAGGTSSVVDPLFLASNGNFRNSYEQSKAEAELEVRRETTVQSCIFRPSVIVGDSVTGQTSAFNVLYIPSKFILKGLLRVLPASPTAPFDVVPVDYVADAIVALSRLTERSSDAYHLTVGVGRESTPLEILEHLLQAFEKYRVKGRGLLHVPTLISPERLSALLAKISAAYSQLEKWEESICRRLPVLKHILPFVPYMTDNPQFDTSATRRDLAETLGQPPLFTYYSERIFAYCIQTDWGRLPWTNPANYRPWFMRDDSGLRIGGRLVSPA